MRNQSFMISFAWLLWSVFAWTGLANAEPVSTSSYSKISADGKNLAVTATVGGKPSDWACTRDEATSLVWEIKSATGIRGKDVGFVWQSPNQPDGNQPIAADCESSGRCDLASYVRAINASGLCGFKDWRVPTVAELEGLIDRRKINPSINRDYFPNTVPTLFWTSTPDAQQTDLAKVVNFYYGNSYSIKHANPLRVRLVRGGS